VSARREDELSKAKTAEDHTMRLTLEANLLPGIGHVPHMEAPERFYPPLMAFLKDAARAN
jgi:pimeloyl-ACP methyl ester carboxylesterase